MKNARLVLVVSSILVFALAASAIAAKPKAEFKPKVGDYVGVANLPTGPTQVTGTVAKEGKKFIVQAVISAPEVCTDGSQYPAGVAIPATVTGKTFSASDTGIDSFTGGTATYEISGRFTSANQFTGTASKSSTPGPKAQQAGVCKTGTIKFTLHLKG